MFILGAPGALGHAASSPVSEMTVIGIYASKPGDTTVYCLLGGSACLVPKDAGTADQFIAQWLKSHPGASVTPVSSATQTMPISTKPGSAAKLHEADADLEAIKHALEARPANAQSSPFALPNTSDAARQIVLNPLEAPNSASSSASREGVKKSGLEKPGKEVAERVGFEPTCRNYPTIRFRVGAVMTTSVPLR
jgi:hypothetical protein